MAYPVQSSMGVMLYGRCSNSVEYLVEDVYQEVVECVCLDGCVHVCICASVYVRACVSFVNVCMCVCA